MIIPPDPEKDPRLFEPSASTPSLLPPPSDLSSDLPAPEAAHLRSHPYQVVLDDGSRWEALPPYSKRRPGDPTPLTSVTSLDDSIIQRRSQPHPPQLFIPPRASTELYSSIPSSDGSITPTASSSRLPIVNPALGPVSSTAKLWESSSTTVSSFGKPGKRRVLGFNIPRSPGVTSPKTKAWWKKWKRWMYALFGFLFVGIGLMIGLLVGWKQGLFDPPPPPSGNSWSTNGYNGQRSTQWTPSTNSNLNFTWTPSRDNPPAEWGVMSQCNNFVPLIATNLSELSVPFPSNTLKLASFSFPLMNVTNTTSWSLPADFFIYSTGLASGGTVEFVGSDAPANIIAGGTEAQITVDVVVRYGGPQDITQIMQVCEMTRPTGAVGIGIFTPETTDGKITSVYQLDPTQLPQFQVTVRVPPSVIYGWHPLSLPYVDLMLERMAVRFGDMQAVGFEAVNITQGRGGITAGYIAAETVSIVAGDNAVIGKYNVSQSLLVNVTAGAIIADVILWDPLNPNTTASLAPPDLARRGPRPPWQNVSIPVAQMLSNATSNHTIQTTFVTSEGYVKVAYLQQPPTTALQSIIATGQGGIDVSLHPNYVGPFAVRNNWGMVRLPPPVVNQFNPDDQGRKRYVSEGPINTTPDGMFSAWGVNATNLVNSGQFVTGAAYWDRDNSTAPSRSGPQTPIAIQLDADSQGSQLMVAGAWGDVTLKVDGS